MGAESISMPMHLDRKQKPFSIVKTTFSSSQLHKGHPDYRTNRAGEHDVPLRFMNSPLPLSTFHLKGCHWLQGLHHECEQFPVEICFNATTLTETELLSHCLGGSLQL